MTLFSRTPQILGIYWHMASTFNSFGSLSSTEPNLLKTKINATQKVKVMKTKLGLYVAICICLMTMFIPTPNPMPYQHNRTGSRALCFEIKSNKSLKTSKLHKYPKLQSAQTLTVLRWNQNSKNSQNIQKIQNIQNFKIYNEYKVQERWLDLQAVQGSSELCFESKNCQNIQNIPKLQNIPNSKISKTPKYAMNTKYRNADWICRRCKAVERQGRCNMQSRAK